MKRILLSAALLVAIGAFVVLAGGASSGGSSSGTYKIELDDAFGLSNGTQFKVAGVPVGTINKIELCSKDPEAICQNPLHAVLTVNISSKGFEQFRSDAFCESRPQSLIGEYFVECQPGSRGQILTPGSHNPACNKSACTIPVTNTQSTIPADLLANVMRLPYRQRFSLIINELGAAVAGRSGDLQAALQRAVPALTQTDNLLNLLANDSATLQSLTVNSDQVITALADNTQTVQRFIDEANNISVHTANQASNLQATLHLFPGFLEQLQPAMQKLSAAAVANTPVLQNLNAATGHNGATRVGPDQLRALFSNIAPCSQPHADNQCGFAAASLPAIRALGQASLTGRPAMVAALPTVHHLNQFAQPTPELAQNLSIVLQDLDTQNRAVEPDTRSPGGNGFSGLQALLWYAYNQPLAINAYSNFGHLLTVEAYVDPRCSPYATPQSVANGLAAYGPSYRQCYAWLGPNQQGINEPDPSNPGACVPDPGGAPLGHVGPTTSVCKLQPNPAVPKAADVSGTAAPPSAGSAGSSTAAQSSPPASSSSGSSGSASSSGSSGSAPSAGAGGSPHAGSSGIDLAGSLGHALTALGGGSAGGGGASAPATDGGAASGGGASTGGGSGTASGGGSGSPNQAQQLLNYLLAP